MKEELNQRPSHVLDHTLSCVEQEEIFGPVLLNMQVTFDYCYLSFVRIFYGFDWRQIDRHPLVILFDYHQADSLEEAIKMVNRNRYLFSYCYLLILSWLYDALSFLHFKLILGND